MPSVSRGTTLGFGAGAGAFRSNARASRPAADCGKLVRWLAVAVSAASLAACAQSPFAGKRAGVLAPTRQAAAVQPPAPSYSQGLASFYTEGTQTANGEKFDTYAMTAAHRTLPFGTQLRVTSLVSGRSVTVRINDRGPYIKGRVVDLSYSAARALGMVDAGVAKVRLDVVRRPARRVPLPQARRICAAPKIATQAPRSGCDGPDRRV
jgi:rare lipoprotein A